MLYAVELRLTTKKQYRPLLEEVASFNWNYRVLRLCDNGTMDNPFVRNGFNDRNRFEGNIAFK